MYVHVKIVNFLLLLIQESCLVESKTPQNVFYKYVYKDISCFVFSRELPILREHFCVTSTVFTRAIRPYTHSVLFVGRWQQWRHRPDATDQDLYCLLTEYSIKI